MVTMDKKAELIIDNLFDIMMNTDYREVAEITMVGLLKDHNVFVDKSKGIIEIQDGSGQLVLYTIKIEKGEDYDEQKI